MEKGFSYTTAMSDNFKNTRDFAEYLQSVVKLEALEKMTQDLDEELADSQRIMSEIKIMFDSIPNQNHAGTTEKILHHEDLSNILGSGMPKHLLKDMAHESMEVDLDDVISAMRQYAEDLKKNFVHIQPQSPFTNQVVPKRDLESLNLQQYASSLDQLSKRLANIKLNKASDENRNEDLEAKLGQLCQDVSMFTQMVQAKKTISECNQNWSTPQDSAALHYDNIINKLLSGINEVTYLLQNKN